MLLLLSLAFYVFRDVTFSYKHLTKSFFRAKVPDPRRQTRGESLVFRSKYLDASYFPAVLRAFLARSPVALTLVNSSRWVPYAELAALHACVLLPWDPATMAFYELQALNVPTAVPDPAFLLRVREGTEPSLAFCATL